MAASQAISQGQAGGGASLSPLLRGIARLACENKTVLRNIVLTTGLLSAASCEAKTPSLETSAGCFTAIAFSKEPIYFPSDLQRWERALERNFPRAQIFEKIDVIVAGLDELEDSTERLRELGTSCADVLKRLEAAEA